MLLDPVMLHIFVFVTFVCLSFVIKLPFFVSHLVDHLTAPLFLLVLRSRTCAKETTYVRLIDTRMSVDPEIRELHL